MKPITLIVKPVSTGCNLACDYCYHGEAKKRLQIRRMGDELLEKLISEFSLLDQPRSKFLWHGGEPTLAGQDFFGKAVSLQKDYFTDERVAMNSIQTNGTTINESWISFFKMNKFGVGISLDGPKDVHDRHRRDFSGNGTFGRVISRISMMAASGLHAGVVCTVTKPVVNDARRLLQFFVENGMTKLNFSPAADLCAGGMLAKYSLSPEEWGYFLHELFDAWVELGNKDVEIQLFENLLQVAFGGEAKLCTINRNCGEFISVDADGLVYVCGRFLGNKDFLAGDLKDTSLQEILKSSRCEKIVSAMTYLPQRCEDCEAQKFCNGGCAYYRFLDGKQRNDPYFCESMKAATIHIKEFLLGCGAQDSTIWAKP